MCWHAVHITLANRRVLGHLAGARLHGPCILGALFYTARRPLPVVHAPRREFVCRRGGLWGVLWACCVFKRTRDFCQAGGEGGAGAQHVLLATAVAAMHRVVEVVRVVGGAEAELVDLAAAVG